MVEVSLWGQFLTILVMAFALSMDAFSLGLGMGMKGIRLLDILKVSTVTGIFHVILPLTGIFMGQFMNDVLGHLAVAVGGALLVILGVHMIYNSLFGEVSVRLGHRSMSGVILFAFMVSLDSFSVGISLGIFATNVLLTVTLFGLFSGIACVIGLLLGRRFGGWIGDYGETIGGAILTAVGLKFLF